MLLCKLIWHAGKGNMEITCTTVKRMMFCLGQVISPDDNNQCYLGLYSILLVYS